MSPHVARAAVFAAALAAALLTARLGVWQLDRARQKAEIEDAVAARAALPPLNAAALPRTVDRAAPLHHRPALLAGRWLAAHTVWLDNRALDGRAGFVVVTPLLIGPGDAVAVQRGWLPRHPVERDRLPPLATPGGRVEVRGRLAPPPSNLVDLGGLVGRPRAAETGSLRQNLDLDAFEREIGATLRPLTLQQTEPERVVDGEAGPEAAVRAPPAASEAPAAGAPPAVVRRWPAVAGSPAKHHAYAAQWFALSALVTGLYVWFQLLRPRRRGRPA